MADHAQWQRASLSLRIPEGKNQIRSRGGQRALEPRGKYSIYLMESQPGVSSGQHEVLSNSSVPACGITLKSPSALSFQRSSPLA